MKKLTALFLAMLMLVTLTACGSSNSGAEQKKPAAENTASASIQDKVAEGNHKVLVAYFTWSGNTEKAAQQIHDIVGGDLFKIETAQAYPSEYKTTTEQAKKEKADKARPALKSQVPNMADYDVVFVGYPIWWYTAPMAVFTFMESYDFTGKTVIPFCTSGGSGIEESMKDMQTLAGKGTVVKGFNCNNAGGIRDWLKSIGMAK